LNSHQRRVHRRMLSREWPYKLPWRFLEYGTEFSIEFDKWRKEEGLTVEFYWEKIDYNNYGNTLSKRRSNG